MSNWEELDEQIKTEETQNALENKILTDLYLYNCESNVILLQKPKQEVQTKVIPKKDGYNGIWDKKNKALLARNEERENAIVNLPESDKTNKRQELTEICDVQDFRGVSTEDKELPKENEKVTFLKTEKDFIYFGLKVAAKLNRKEEYENVEKAKTKKRRRS